MMVKRPREEVIGRRSLVHTLGLMADTIFGLFALYSNPSGWLVFLLSMTVVYRQDPSIDLCS